MESKVRITRTLKPTEIKIPPEDLQNIAQLWDDPRYRSLIDVMERACISLDTALIETDVKERAAVLAGHCVSKAAWLFSVYVQRQVEAAYYSRTTEEVEQTPALDDVIQGVEGFGVYEELAGSGD